MQAGLYDRRHFDDATMNCVHVILMITSLAMTPEKKTFYTVIERMKSNGT